MKKWGMVMLIMKNFNNIEFEKKNKKKRMQRKKMPTNFRCFSCI